MVRSRVDSMWPLASASSANDQCAEADTRVFGRAAIHEIVSPRQSFGAA